MNSLAIAETLDALTHVERRSMIPRLRELEVFVSWASAEDAGAVDDMIHEEHEHLGWLVELMNEMGESPTPCTADVRTTSIHFVDLSYLLPGVIEDEKNIIRFYEQTVQSLSEHARAATLVGSILDRHRVHLQTLEDMTPRLEPAEAAQPEAAPE